MKLEFELKKTGESRNFIQYDVLRKGLVVGFLSVDKAEEIKDLNRITMEE